MNPSCTSSHMFMPLRVLTLEPFCVHAYTHKYTYIISQIFTDTFCIRTHAAQTHICLCPLRVLTVRTSLYTYIYPPVLVYMQCIMDSFVSEKRESPTPLYISNIPDQPSSWTASALLDISAPSYQFTKYTISPSSSSVQITTKSNLPNKKKRTKPTVKQTPID